MRVFKESEIQEINLFRTYRGLLLKHPKRYKVGYGGFFGSHICFYKRGFLGLTRGVTGRDLKLSPAAREIYPLAIECKNVEALNIWAAYEQAKKHAEGSTDFPIVFFKRNKSELMVTLLAEDFMKLVR
jgi:hypothetical protein